MKYAYIISRASQALTVAALALLVWSPQAAFADTQVRTSSFEYDAAGLLVKEVVEPDSPNDCLATSYTYDIFGNRTGVTTGACAGASGTVTWSATTPRKTTTGYGVDGRFAVLTSNALGQSEIKSFDPRFGVVTSLTGPNGLNTTWTYDGFGRKTRESRADGTFTTWTYKLCTESGAACPSPIGGVASAWVTIEQDFGSNAVAISAEKRRYHDGLGRILRTQSASYDGLVPGQLIVQDTEYGPSGRIRRQSQRYFLNGGHPQWSTYTYDSLDRVVWEQRPDPDAPGGVATTTTEYAGLLIVVTNSAGQSKTTEKNAQGQIAIVRNTHGAAVTYTYDALGQLIRTETGGAVTTMVYNKRGHKVGMSDSSMGAWEYRYNVFGELVSQRDSLNQVVTMAYDALGRMIQRTEPDLVSQWSYDRKFDGVACGKSIGKLCEAKANNGYLRTHTYDSLGRPSSTMTLLDKPATVSITYEERTGRISSKTWPTGYRAVYQYTPNGYLKSVTASASGAAAGTPPVSMEIKTMNPDGNVTGYMLGNQVVTTRKYDDATGRLKSQVALRSGYPSGVVIDQAYTYDTLGNLKTRIDNSPGVGTQEGFVYDSLNRLSLYTTLGGGIAGTQAIEVLYDMPGNIVYKSDTGSYWYDPARPNRLTNITRQTHPAARIPYTGTRALSYAFDDFRPGAKKVDGKPMGNGNLWYTVSQDTVNNQHTVRWEDYTSFNMPRQILSGKLLNTRAPTNAAADRTLSFVYGPEHQRIKQQLSTTSSAYSSGTTWHLNGEDSMGLSFEREIRTTGMVEERHYLSAGGITFAMHVSRSGNRGPLPATATRYFHHDHLGSIAAITDHTGEVMERLAYDPWGKRRNVNGTPDVLDAIVGQNTDRGYTMHEHLDEVGVIHMNGRIYDPLIGRFMSADPFIQSPHDLQSHNRYAYVLNNPLSHTDPSGYFSLKKFLRTVVSIVVASYTGAWVEALSGSVVAGGAAGGFAAGAVNTGNLNGAMQGAFGGALFGAAGLAGGPGQLGANSIARYAAHATAGCVSSAAFGGNCGSGATSALFGKFATNQIAGMGGKEVGDQIARGVATAVAGGVGSVIGGGTFENGATTAAFGYLFNHLGHSGAEQVEQYRAESGISSPTLGSYLPGTGAGDSAAQYWADLHVSTGNSLYAVPGMASSLWTPDTAVGTAFTLGTAGAGGIRAIPEGVSLGWKSTAGIWAHTYKHGGGGVNFFLGGSRVLAADSHAFKLNGVTASRLHYHRGLTPATQKLHRPYQGGW